MNRSPYRRQRRTLIDCLPGAVLAILDSTGGRFPRYLPDDGPYSWSDASLYDALAAQTGLEADDYLASAVASAAATLDRDGRVEIKRASHPSLSGRRIQVGLVLARPLTDTERWICQTELSYLVHQCSPPKLDATPADKHDWTTRGDNLALALSSARFALESER